MVARTNDIGSHEAGDNQRMAEADQNSELEEFVVGDMGSIYRIEGHDSKTYGEQRRPEIHLVHVHKPSDWEPITIKPCSPHTSSCSIRSTGCEADDFNSMN